MTRRAQRIPNAVPHLGGNEWRYVKECLDTNWVSSAGPFVDRFERAIAERVGVPHAVATVNGTAALHVALLAAGVGRGDEVLVPAMTFIATANAVAYCGASPVFMDSDEETWGMDPDKVAEFLEERCVVKDDALVNRASGRRVRALLPVDLYGHPCRLEPLLRLARRHGLAVVEDAAEALGALVHGRPVGGGAPLACLSFNGNKIVTAGGGGMVLTHDEAMARRIRHLTTQARRPGPEYLHDEIGFNYRLTNVHAALGLAQLEQLDAFVADKRRTATHYQRALGGLDGVHVFCEAPWARSTYWMSSVLVSPRRCADVQALVEALDADGIQARPLWRPLTTQPAFRGCEAYGVEVAQRLHSRGLSLPCSVGITEAEREAVVEALVARLA